MTDERAHVIVRPRLGVRGAGDLAVHVGVAAQRGDACLPCRDVGGRGWRERRGTEVVQDDGQVGRGALGDLDDARQLGQATKHASLQLRCGVVVGELDTLLSMSSAQDLAISKAEL